MKRPDTKSKDLLKRAHGVLATTTIDSDFVPAKGNGVILWDEDGNRYYDFTSFVGVCNLGYGKSVRGIRSAVRMHEDLTGFSHTMSHDWANKWEVELAEKLREITPGTHKKDVFFSCTGTEANEAAIKLLINARPEKRRFISFKGAFHGRTLGPLPLMGGKPVRIRQFPMAYPVHHLEFPGHFKKLTPEKYMTLVKNYFESFVPLEEVNAVFIELIQGEGGINPADPMFLNPLLDFFRKLDIKIVVDEIQTGFGRTGKMFACEHYGLVPDIITLAKGMASGVGIIGATVFDANLDFKELGRHSNTFGGNSSACVATLKNIERMQAEMKRDDKTCTYLHRRLEETCARINKKTKFIKLSSVRGKGWMLGTDVLFNNDGKLQKLSKVRDKVVASAVDKGLLLIGSGKSAIRFMPPVIITEKEINEALYIFEQLPIWR